MSLFSRNLLPLIAVLWISRAVAQTGETLYNGISLPEAWPPKTEKLSSEPQPVPYLVNPPPEISIDVGRQLFVDDFLVEKTTLVRNFHQAEYFSKNPVLTADKPWERVNETFYAAPFSDGVWYDPQDGKFKMWYLAGDLTKTCYAESMDGIHWKKPKLDVVPGTNIVLETRRDSATVWLDQEELDPRRRYMMFVVSSSEGWRLRLHYSADGIHWSEPAAVAAAGHGDRTTMFYNPFRKKWVVGLRIYAPQTVGRARAYLEDGDPAAAIRRTPQGAVPWISADRLDPRHLNPQWRSIKPQLYNHDAIAYESLLLGLYSIWQGPDNAVSRKRGNHKRCDILLGFSRDGFHWDRPDRQRFIACDETDGAWNWGNIQSVGGGCLVVGDKLYFYVSGRALDPTGRQGRMSTGLAVLRRDGFASMDAGKQKGMLTTRVLRFKGAHPFVNADCEQGELTAEILDAEGNVIEPFSRENSLPVSTDKTVVALRWKGVSDLSSVVNRPVRFRFHLRQGSLFAFWVSPSISGESRGYVAAGGPGFTQSRDTVGQGALNVDSTSQWIDPRFQELEIRARGPFVRQSDRSLLVADGNWTRTSGNEGKTWSPPVPMVHAVSTETQQTGNGIPRGRIQMIRTAKGTLIAVWMQRKNIKWAPDTKTVLPESTGGQWTIRSTDGGKTWTDRQKLYEGLCGNPPLSMIQTKSGHIVVTCQPMLSDPGNNATCTFVSSDEGETWCRSNIIDLGGRGHHDGAFEATVVELRDGRLWMLMRTNWDQFWEALSEDQGLSWRTIRPSGISASSSPAYITRLASGRLALLWNRLYPEGKSSYPRSVPGGQGSEAAASWHREELSLSFSEDEAKTWSRPILVARDARGLCYPYLYEPEPGLLWILATGRTHKFQVKAREKDLVQDTQGLSR